MLFKKVVIGISGGVDSAVAALLLKNKGYQVQAVFMQNWDIRDETGICRSDEDFQDASSACKILKIPIRKVNFVREYWNSVFSEMLTQYQNGYTPNPDVLCNRFIKFDSFYHYAKDTGADAIATGHYARTSFGCYLDNYDKNENVKLFVPKDTVKDQTLFLAQVKQEALRRTMFPLGNLTKSEVKEIARQNGLEMLAEKKESMGICFIGKRNFQDFISEYLEDNPGKFVNVDDGKIVGEHCGLHHWTLGQRTKINGLPVALFTAKKNVVTNNIYVAKGTTHKFLYSKTLFTGKPHWIDAHPAQLKNGQIFECHFKFQHADNSVDCLVLETPRGLAVQLTQATRSLTPGQFAVFYKDGECLGSAVIKDVGPSSFTLGLLEQLQSVGVDNNEKDERKAAVKI